MKTSAWYAALMNLFDLNKVDTHMMRLGIWGVSLSSGWNSIRASFESFPQLFPKSASRIFDLVGPAPRRSSHEDASNNGAKDLPFLQGYFSHMEICLF